jgi:hypothetical protein
MGGNSGALQAAAAKPLGRAFDVMGGPAGDSWCRDPAAPAAERRRLKGVRA